jgi:protein transport protein HofC
MEFILTILLIPSLGGLLLLAEWQSRDALGRDARQAWRFVLLLCGLVLAPIGLGLCVYGVRRFFEFDWVQSLLLIGRLILAAVVVAGGWRALRVAWLGIHSDGEPLTLEEETRRDRQTDQMRLAAWVMVLFPVFWMILALLVPFGPILYLVAVYATARRAREGRLLWLLAIAVEHRLPLADEIEGFAWGLWGRPRTRVLQLADRLRDGSTLAGALGAVPGLLPQPTLMAVRIGEETGTLGPVLRDCAVRHCADLQRTHVDGSLATLILYYWFVFCTLAFVLGFLCYWIVPKFRVIFADFGVELPEVTQQMIRVSDVFVGYVWLVVPALGLPLTIALLLTWVHLIGWGNLNWPLVMRWFPRRDTPGVLHGLAYAVASGKPLPAVVEDAALAQPRRDLSARLGRVSRALQQGDDTWASLHHEGLLDGLETSAMAAASRAGHLAFALQSLADSLERARQQRLLWWVEFCKPFVILGVGTIVALYCVSFFLPLVKLLNVLG